MATTFERFWNDKDGKEYGLIGQSTTNPNKGVAVQVDEATGETLVRIPATSPVTVVQSNPALLKCEPTQTDGTKLSARVHRDDDTGIASEATLGVVRARLGGTTPYRSAAAEACASVAAVPGVINSGFVYNQGAALAYLQFHNLAAAPAPGAVPTDVLGEIAAGDTVPWPGRVPGTVGLQVCLSSTRDTYTAYANMRALLWVE